MIEALLGRMGISADGLLEAVAAVAFRQISPLIDRGLADLREMVLSRVAGDQPPSLAAALERHGFNNLPPDVQQKLWTACVDAAAESAP